MKIGGFFLKMENMNDSVSCTQTLSLFKEVWVYKYTCLKTILPMCRAVTHARIIFPLTFLFTPVWPDLFHFFVVVVILHFFSLSSPLIYKPIRCSGKKIQWRWLIAFVLHRLLCHSAYIHSPPSLSFYLFHIAFN